MRNVVSNQAQRHSYDAGREARSLDKDKSPPGGLGAQRRSFWLAGYNDRDSELQIAARKKLEAHREQYPAISRCWRAGQTDQVEVINIPACDYQIDMEQN